VSDLISRQDAIDAVHYYIESGYKCDIFQELKNLPSAEPERKKGAWTGDCCSCCGVSKYNYIKMVDDECGPFGTWNFCPHCGADMRGENEKA
jgi:hypothetical protein